MAIYTSTQRVRGSRRFWKITREPSGLRAIGFSTMKGRSAGSREKIFNAMERNEASPRLTASELRKIVWEIFGLEAMYFAAGLPARVPTFSMTGILMEPITASPGLRLGLQVRSGPVGME